MTSNKEEALRAYLSRLPLKIAAPLAAAVEADRLSGNGTLPHDLILGSLRPVLRNAGAGEGVIRVPTPLRLFCEPFEDLLVPEHSLGKHKGRIARSSIRPVWEWASRDLRGGALGARARRLNEALLAGQSAAIAAETSALQHEAGEAMGEALAADAKLLSGLAAQLGKPVLEDARDMAACLLIAADTAALRTELPRRIGALDDDMAGLVRDVFEKVAAAHPDQAYYVPLIVLGRLEHPWEILRVVAKIVRQHTDYLASQTDLHIVGDLLLHDLEVLASQIEHVDASNFNAAEVGEKVLGFARAAQGLTHELDIRREGPWGQRLVELRARLAKKMERLIEQASREVASLLPLKRPTNPKRRHERHPDLSRALDPERLFRAQSLAALLVTCRGVASHMAFGAVLTEAMDSLTAMLSDYSPAILQAVRESDEELKPIALAYLDAAVALTRHIGGEAEADLLRRKGAVAAGG